MKNISLYAILFFLFGSLTFTVKAQIASASDNLIAQPIPDRSVLFDYLGIGVSKPMIWGMDAGGWTSPLIWTTGINYLGAENIKITRVPVFPTDTLYGDTLQLNQKKLVKDRLSQAGMPGHPLQIMLNHGGGEISWYSRDSVGHARYALLMELTKKYIESFGHTVVSITGYNEPDYGWDGASMDDFKNFIIACKKRPGLSGLRFCGGNTLNDDLALSWYNYIKPAGLTEGNTHQLAGSFDSYANFYQTVRANGDYATSDEVHDIMEGIVGAEYGMQAGIYWGYASLARGEFVKACNGVRLGYAEHRPNWTAAAVYRKTDGQVQAFCGASERQATTTMYRYVSKDRDVYYEGYGPQREYTLVMPGGDGYGVNQPYAERVINISWGDDIQQPINGNYVLVNRNSGKVMTVPLGLTSNGITLNQSAYNATYKYQQWKVTPISSRTGGDFSYLSIINAGTNKSADLVNYSLDNGANIEQWDSLNGGNQQWYLEYAGDGWFYIRSHHSSMCLQAANGSTSSGAGIVQWAKNGTTTQQWRFIPVGAPVEFVAPGAPSNLVATPNAESVRLDWSANTESDLAGYNILRADVSGGPYNTIARNVKTTSFVDNTAISGQTYYYTIKAVDNSLNRSANSNEVFATPSGNNTLVTSLQFEGNTLDNSVNLNHSAKYGSVSYVTGKTGSQAIALNGSNAFVQLPATVANHKEITIATWVYWNGGSTWQRIFDFGNDATQYMTLTPKTALTGLRFGIKNGGSEQVMTATALQVGQWSHVAVTLSASGASMYINGKQVATSSAITINPMDFKPVLNYIGRSQTTTTPLFNGYIDDFRVYNYALSSEDVSTLYSGILSVKDVDYHKGLNLWPVPANEVLHIKHSSGNNGGLTTYSIYDMSGRMVMNKQGESAEETELNVSGLPSGVYILKMSDSEETLMDKVVIKH